MRHEVVSLLDVDNTLLGNDRVRRESARSKSTYGFSVSAGLSVRKSTVSECAARCGACEAVGPAVILSDGDVVFHPRKVERAGLLEPVDGNALIYIHKQLELEDVEQHYPAQHYVLVDDNLRILAAVKHAWGSRVTKARNAKDRPGRA